MTNKIILKISPLDGYFFGSENKTHDEISDYFLKSLLIPQQSSILGAIRYMFLNKVAGNTIFNKNQIIDKSEAAIIIGEESFNLIGTDFKFGKILSVSEVFMLNNEKVFLTAPFDSYLKSFEIYKSNFPNYSDYSPKDHFNNCLTNGNDEHCYCKIFHEVIQPGNKKDKKSDDDKDAFYKQQYFYLEKDWAFGIELESDEESLNNFNTPFFIKMGGQNKLFKIEKITNSQFNRNTIYSKYSNKDYFKVILSSDSFLKSDPYQFAVFSFTKTKNFRNLKSKIVQVENYYNRSKKYTDLTQSDLFEVFERGSVFYFENKEKLDNFKGIIKNDYLEKAGMNQYVELNPIEK